MEIFLVTIFIVGIISAVFGVLLIFAPDVILRVEEKANILYMTDTAFLKNRIPLGIAMLGISAFSAISDAIRGCAKSAVFPKLDAPATAERILMTIQEHKTL